MRIFYLFTFLIFSGFKINAQTTGYSGTGNNIDVDNYQIWWRINPDSLLGIKGTVKIKFKTTADNVTNITFDLRNVFTVSSIIYNGAALTTTPQPNSSHIISIPVNIPVSGTRDSIIISYSGTPPTASGQAAGYNLGTDPSVTAGESAGFGTKRGFPVSAGSGKMVNTLSESYEDRDWWPCKADMKDKADTIDITVNVPWQKTGLTDTFWVASNGTLIDSTIDAAGKSRTFKYINRYPMASYLVCVGVARYTRFYRGTINIGAPTLVPVVYYLYPGKADYTPILAAMDKATEALALFSTKFGKYGFTDPSLGGKHGFYEGLSPGGGMEHQTFSAIGTESLTNVSILIHELMHQWFGDKVSFSTWNDLWLAEGFAEYSPSLAAETITGTGYTAFNFLNGIKSRALDETAPVYIPASGIVSSNTIWSGGTGATGYGSTVYNRGAMVLSMLRRLSGDTKYFNILKDYQTVATLQYKSATTDTLLRRFSDTLGIDLTEFFKDNVEGTGYPYYDILYQYSGAGSKTLSLSVGTQSRRLGSVSPYTPNASVPAYFNNPVVVHVKGVLPANDTTIVFYDWGSGDLSKAGNGVQNKISGNRLTYQLSFTPTSIAYDDSARTMSIGTMSPTILVDLKTVDFTVKQHTAYNEALLTMDGNSIHTNVLLERSGDGVNFEVMGNMALQASASLAKKYVFEDMQPLKTDNYYRAKYKNAEGIFMYSKIIKTGGAKGIGYAIINNPVHDLLQIRTTEVSAKEITLQVYDAASRLIISKQVSSAGSGIDIPITGLNPGMYVLKIADPGEEAQNLKFIVR